MQTARVLLGDCREHLKTLDSDSLDSLVTDPPAGISFMGKAWDSYESLQHFRQDLTLIFQEALRVLKPGAHGLVWALPRTAHHTALALELAGFEVRDMITHLFGSGMPKGANLKPAQEVWWLIRKPCVASSAVQQVKQTGTGKLQIESSRLTSGRWPTNAIFSHEYECTEQACESTCSVAELDRQSGRSRGFGFWNDRASTLARPNAGDGNTYSSWFGRKLTGAGYMDEGGASRFFYVAKICPSERKLPDGTLNQHPTAKSIKLMRYLVRLVTPPNGTCLDPFAGSGTTGVASVKEGFSFLGVELDGEHHRVAELRVRTALREREEIDLVQEMLSSEEP